MRTLCTAHEVRAAISEAHLISPHSLTTTKNFDLPFMCGCGKWHLVDATDLRIVAVGMPVKFLFACPNGHATLVRMKGLFTMKAVVEWTCKEETLAAALGVGNQQAQALAALQKTILECSEHTFELAKDGPNAFVDENTGDLETARVIVNFTYLYTFLALHSLCLSLGEQRTQSLRVPLLEGVARLLVVGSGRDPDGKPGKAFTASVMEGFETREALFLNWSPQSVSGTAKTLERAVAGTALELATLLGIDASQELASFVADALGESTEKMDMLGRTKALAQLVP